MTRVRTGADAVGQGAKIKALLAVQKSAAAPPPGGIAGFYLMRLLFGAAGFLGAGLFFAAGLMAGFTLFTGVSWLAIFERCGGGIEKAALRLIGVVKRREDRRRGRAASESRVETVARARRKIADKPAAKIEPVFAPEKEKPLFVAAARGRSAAPPLSLLVSPPPGRRPVGGDALEYTGRLIESKLRDFGVEVKVEAIHPGPVITRFEIEPAVGVKGAAIVGLMRDLARALSVRGIRVLETIPGSTRMGLEIPNARRETVYLAEVLASSAYARAQTALPLALGKDVAGRPFIADLARMPHLLVAGTTGAGKSVSLNAMLLSLLYKSAAADVRLIMIDPKMLELSVYRDIPHLLAPVVVDMNEAHTALNWCVAEMERRYRLMANADARNVDGFNRQIAAARAAGKPLTVTAAIAAAAGGAEGAPLEKLPYIVVIIDELADLMMVAGKKIEQAISRLAQKARAAGIHLLLATQRPSVDVITGLIKANIASRIAFQVSSKVDSRTILDQGGAEALLGKGDMLFTQPSLPAPERIHGAFVSDGEVGRVTAWLKEKVPPPAEPVDFADAEKITPALTRDGGGGNGVGGGEEDPLYDQAVEVVLETRRASISLVQRKLRIGYNRAARLIEEMENAKLVSAMDDTGARKVLVPKRSD